MTSRPNFLLAAAVCIGLFVCSWLMLDLSPLYIWSQVDPVSHAAYRLRTAYRFTGPTLSDEMQLESPLGYWRTVAHAPAADSIFDALASDTSLVAQLYGIAGITRSKPDLARRLAERVAADTTALDVVLGACAGPISIKAQTLAVLVSNTQFVREMLLGDSVCRVHTRGGA
jgi:hypothetical protein